MIVILILLVMAAASVAAIGVVSNTGRGHAVGGDFSIAGLHLTNLSTGQLFLYGVIIGVVGMLALSILIGVVFRRLALHQSQRRLESSRHATDSLRVDYDRLNQQLDDERAANVQAVPVVHTDPAGDTANGHTEIDSEIDTESVESVEQDSDLFDEPATDEAPDETGTPEHAGPRRLIGRREQRRP